MIRVLNPGMLTTIQDGGRYGYQRFGVPVCGAMDAQALAVANLLVGNSPTEGALELTALGPTIRFESDNIFALAGADFSPTLNGVPVPTGYAVPAHGGDVLECGAAKDGFRGYIAFSGGLDVPVLLESKSTCLPAKFGGFHGRALQKNDVIAFSSPQYWIKGLSHRKARLNYDPGAPVRVVLGPQADAFSREGLDTFFSSEYRVGNNSDRMGSRLEGAEIRLKAGVSPNILSDGVAMGSIQVPNGQPIVMMADRQTTGGYVKLGCVITVDLPLMAQRRPGDKVRFVPVTLEEAQRLLTDRQRRFRNLGEDLEHNGSW